MRGGPGGFARTFAPVFLIFLVSAAPPAFADDAVMAFTVEEVAGSISAAAEDVPRPQPPPGTTREGPDAQLDAMLGELRWGMSSKQLLAALKARIKADYDRQIKVERDILRQDELYQAAKARMAAIKDSFVVFDARKNGWDASQLAPEFRRGTDETMLWVQSEQSRDYYFFVHDRLWKWYREIEPATRGALTFDKLATMMQAQLGPAKFEAIQRAEIAPVQSAAIWQSSQTRVTLLDRGAAPCVIMESTSVLAELAVLRQGALDRGTKRNAVVEGVLMDAGERERWRARMSAD